MQLQQAMYGGEAMNEEVDRQIASEEKEDTQKSFSSNPIMDAAMSYIEKNWGDRERSICKEHKSRENAVGVKCTPSC